MRDSFVLSSPSTFGKMTKTTTKQLLWLDLLRGIAALIVLMGHLRSVLFQDYEKIQNPNAIAKAFYFITGFGHQAVILFFVLSGFFIIKSIHDAHAKNNWSWKQYLLNRLSRLWMVLIPGLILGAFWDQLGLYLNPHFDIYTGAIEHLVYFNPQGHLGLGVFLGNLFFLQTIFFPTYGTNGALWSLSNEFWYYIIFPCLYIAYQVRTAISRKIIFFFIGMLLLSAFQYFSLDVATHPRDYFFIWMFGGLSLFLSRQPLNLFKTPITSVILAGMLIGMLIGIRIQLLPLIFNDWGLGVITLLLVCGLSQIEMTPLWLQKISSFLSNISYTLYIVHLPFVVFISSQMASQRLDFSTTNLIIYLGIFFVAILYAYSVYYLFERNTNRVKHYIQKFIK